MRTGRPSLAELWRAFEARDRTLSPRPDVRREWHRGRLRYAVWIARVTAPDAAERVAEGQARLASLIRPVPETDLHITLFVCGFPSDSPASDDDIERNILGRQVEALSGAAPIRCQLTGAGSYPGAAFLRVEDDRAFARVRGALQSAYPAGHRGELRFAPYDPHVTLGNYVEELPTARAAAALAPLRDAAPLALELRDVELVDFDARVEGAPLRTLERVEL